MNKNEEYYNRSINTSIRIGFIVLLLILSFLIVKPFLMPVLWGLIIAVAIYPQHLKLTKILGGRKKLSAAIITIIGVAILVIPAIILLESTVNGIINFADIINSGKSIIPIPPEAILEWKIIGKPIYEIWMLASTSLGDVIIKFSDQLKEVVPTILSIATGLGTTVILFIISVIIGGSLLNQDKNAGKTVTSIFNTLVGDKGNDFLILTVKTIRSVVQGVLGVALIQSFLAGIGFLAIDMPFAGLWSLLIFFMAIVQLPTILVFAPLMIYSFSYTGTTPAIIFTIWSILVGLSDNILKPILLGRGVDVPMLAILLGAIGGMLLWGIIGLFVGSVILALSYKVFLAIFVDDALDD